MPWPGLGTGPRAPGAAADWIEGRGRLWNAIISRQDPERLRDSRPHYSEVQNLFFFFRANSEELN